MPPEASSSRCIKVLTDRVWFVIGEAWVRPSHMYEIIDRLVDTAQNRWCRNFFHE